MGSFLKYLKEEEETKGLNKFQTLDLIKSPNAYDEISSKKIISEWVIEQIEECLQEISGNPTDSEILKWIDNKNHLELNKDGKIKNIVTDKEDAEDNLYALIYYARKEIQKRKDNVEGLKYYSDEELDTLLGKQFEFKLDTLLGPNKIIGKLIKVGNKFGIQPKRMRTKYYSINVDTKLKLVGE